MGIFSKISLLFTGRHELDAVTSESLSDALITADIAPDLAENMVAKLRARGTVSIADAKQILFDSMLPIVGKFETRDSKLETRGPNLEIRVSSLESRVSNFDQSLEKPKVFLVIGVNGAGKTTTIGKLAKQWQDAGKSVVIGAADTFRAAASEQLSAWAARAGAVLITGNFETEDIGRDCPPSRGGAIDPATVAYKAVEYGIKNNSDIVIIDTAGRLHNRSDLMDELAKITRVIKKLLADAPHESLLVLDANTGQNALNQIEYFDRAAKLSGLIVTKMDSTAKGGFLVTYAANSKSPLPVCAIGYGEKIGDLRPFDATEYLNRLLDINP